jgi:hypothetical protein
MTTSAQALTKNPVNTPTKAASKTTYKKAPKALTKSIPKTAQKAIAKTASKAPATAAKSVRSMEKIAIPTDSSKVISKPVEKKLSTKPIKAKKIKLVRDSFTIPKPEYLILDNLKLRAADLKHPVKKSELLRAGIKALAAMTDAHLYLALKEVPALKTGRPSK